MDSLKNIFAIPELRKRVFYTFGLLAIYRVGGHIPTPGINGPALVVRSGGGMAGQSFQPEEGRTLIGRSPECEVFLDDVTVSRRHAELVRDGETFSIRDLGSLNGTYVNRRRIESAVLEDDDEVQIGKYRLTFLQR